MPNRIIREGWIDSARVEQLNGDEERFLLRLMLKADDFGRYHANPVVLKNTLFPLKESVRVSDSSRWLAACEKAGLVRSYETEKGRFLEIVEFRQRTRAEISKYPAPSEAVAGNDGQLTDNCQTEGGHLPARATSPTTSAIKGESEGALPFASEEFATAWNLWLQHRREIKHAVTPTQRAGQLLRLGAMRERAAIAMIRHTISQGWRGLRESDGPGKGGNVIKFEKPMAGAVDSPRPQGNASPELYDKGAESMRLARESLRTGQPIAPVTP